MVIIIQKKIQFFSTDLSEVYENHLPPRTSVRIQVSVSWHDFMILCKNLNHKKNNAIYL